MKKAIFLDRDGVINETIIRKGKPQAPYSLEEFSFIKGVKEAVESLKQKGFLIIVVTNQPDVARGWVPLEQVLLVNNLVSDELKVDDLKACFHTEKDSCPCRKPKPGMILQAAQEWNISLKDSFMVGDRLSDVEAGQSAGCRTILVGPQELASSLGATAQTVPDYQCKNLLEAGQWILSLS